MQLTFEHTQNIGAGTQPSAIHTPDNIVQVLYVSADPTHSGKLYAIDAATPMGAWDNREFNPAYLVCSDIDTEHFKLKYISATSIFAVWKNATEEGEPGTVRHRIAVWVSRQVLSDYFIQGDITLRNDTPIAQISLTFENPDQIISGEIDTLLTPGTMLSLKFRSGDSAGYPMGNYFIDRNSMGVNDSSTSVDGRNLIGKLLNDQTFDEDYNYPLQNLHDMGVAMLEAFDVQNFWVGSTASERGMKFPPDMTGLDGFNELLKTTIWQLKEDLSGQIGFGNKADARFHQPSTYTFNRDTDVFSRSISRDDMEAYSRVCVHNDDFTTYVKRDVQARFPLPRKKSLYVTMAKGTTLTDAEEYADGLAVLLASVGVIETFVGPFLPHLLPDDQARITSSSGTHLLGLVTTVRHMFGKSGQGYATEFTVDSGGRIGKSRISDYIAKVSGNNKPSGQAERLYS